MWNLTFSRRSIGDSFFLRLQSSWISVHYHSHETVSPPLSEQTHHQASKRVSSAVPLPCSTNGGGGGVTEHRKNTSHSPRQ